MPDPTSQYTLTDLAARFGLELRGDGDRLISGVGTLASAGAEQISFLSNRAYRPQLPATRAGAVILKAEDAGRCPVSCLVADDPYLAYARIATLFDPRPAAEPGIHPSAVIAPGAELGDNVSIGPLAVIGADCRVGDGCTIGPGTVLATACRLGAGCHLYANVSLGFGVTLGRRVILHMGVVIGADGFGIAFAGDHWEKVPQLGSVTIGDDCEIGANSCIDRGAIEDTVLEDDVRIDNLCQIGHNVRIGAHTAIAGVSGIAGSTTIGRYCLLGGRSGVSGHLEIADRTTVTAGSNVFKSIREPGTTWSGQLRARPQGEWQRTLVRMNQLEDIARKLNKLEKRLGNFTEDG